MQSFLLPKNVHIYQSIGYIKVEGPYGKCIKKIGELTFNIIKTIEGTRLFISSATARTNSSYLLKLRQLTYGLAYGFRRRLRLKGIGFRGIRHEMSQTFGKKKPSFFIKGFRRKRITFFKGKQSLLLIKIGYSHEVAYPFNSNDKDIITVSRIDSRTKGTLIALKANSLTQLNQIASEIQAFRYPDVYKGKGIYYNREVMKLKKGKRQG